MIAYMQKMPGNVWRPANDESAEALDKFKLGETRAFESRRTRNYKFHRKFFAMLGLAFDSWEPPVLETLDDGVVPEKNRERFRKDVTILAGYYDLVVNLRGEVRAEAKSISFANMDEAEFEKLYSAVVDVVLTRVLKNYTRADLDRVVDQLLGFA